MNDVENYTGMIIKSRPAGDYDRLVTILAGSAGKINVFARGARKPSSRFAASSENFAFGTFKIARGQSSYYLHEADITNYFESFRTDLELLSYASYFAEVADYYCVEGDDSSDMAALLYISFLALESPIFSNRFVRCIFVLRAILINGEFPGLTAGRTYNQAVVAAVERIRNENIKNLFSFKLTENAEDELFSLCREYEKRFLLKQFRSLEFLDSCGKKEHI